MTSSIIACIVKQIDMRLLIFLSSFILGLQIQAQKTETISIRLPDGHLEGTLIVADTTKQTPVVLIIPGSGPTDRNGNNPMAKSNNLKMLADSLAKHHISSLRIDKRGIGKSRIDHFNEANLSFDDFVNDAILWIKKLKNDKRFSKVIIAGHSQGALVGLLAACKTNPDAYISLAGTGYKIGHVIKKQLSQALPSIKKNAYQIIDSLEAGRQVQKVPGLLFALFRPSVQPFLISWMAYDPSEIISRCHLPALIVQGTTDLQVSEDNAIKLKEAQPKAKLVIINGMNHILKQAPDDRQKNLATYNQKDLPLHPELVSKIVAFINEL